MQPERALQLLDTLDGLAYALRLSWAGYQGRRLRNACLLAALGFCTAAMAYPVISSG